MSAPASEPLQQASVNAVISTILAVNNKLLDNPAMSLDAAEVRDRIEMEVVV